MIDAQDAYYRVPTHPDDWKYMGISWAQKYWVFRCLQMGCSSSPKIYTEFADAVEYICVNRSNKLAFYKGLQQLRHYIDDFFAALPTKEMATELYSQCSKPLQTWAFQPVEISVKSHGQNVKFLDGYMIPS